MCRAASAAKRIIRTAPIAKFGAISTFARAGASGVRPAGRSSSSSGSSAKPVVPMTTCTPAFTQASALASALAGVA